MDSLALLEKLCIRKVEIGRLLFSSSGSIKLPITLALILELRLVLIRVMILIIGVEIAANYYAAVVEKVANC